MVIKLFQKVLSVARLAALYLFVMTFMIYWLGALAFIKSPLGQAALRYSVKRKLALIKEG